MPNCFPMQAIKHFPSLLVGKFFFKIAVMSSAKPHCVISENEMNMTSK